mgnify:CR=1 FL=1
MGIRLGIIGFGYMGHWHLRNAPRVENVQVVAAYDIDKTKVEEARSLGVDLKRERGIIIVASTVLTACAVSLAGTIGWVGLIIPHVTRRIVGSDNKRLIPAVILVAAAFLKTVPVMGETGTSKKSAGPLYVAIYWLTTRHM